IISYLLYHNRPWLDEKEVLLFSPNHLFSDYIARVLPSLGETEVPTQTFRSFFSGLIPLLAISQKEQQEEETFLSSEQDPIKRLKSSVSLVSELEKYGKLIASHGPLF